MKPKEKQKHLEGRHFTKTARMSRGRCNTHDKTPLPKSPLEAPACGQAEGKKSTFCKPLNIIFSPSKGCVEVHMFRKTRHDEDVLHQPHQNVSCTGASEMPSFQPVSKQKSTEQHIQAKLNSGDASQRRHKAEAPTQHQKAWKASSSESFPSISSKDRQNDAGPCKTHDKTPLPKSPLEAPACGQAEGKKSAFCKPLNAIFSPSKECVEVHMFRKTRHDEDVFHQPHQNVSCTGASEMTAFQPVRKQKSTEQHIQAKLNSGEALQRRHKAEAPTQRQKAWKASSSESFPSISSKDRQNDAGRRISQDNVLQPESPVEAPACGPAAGEKSSFSEHPIGVSAPSKRTRLYDDVFHQPLQKVSCTGASEMTAFQAVRKRKSTERHIQAKLNSGDALQRRHKAEAPTQRQKAWKASSSESFPSISSKDKQNDTGPCNTQDKATLPKSPLEAPAFGQAEGKKSAFCTPLNVIFSPSKGCMKIQMFGKTPRDEDVFHQPLQKVSCTGVSEMTAFQPVRKRKSTERHIQGRRISQDNVPQPESPVEAPACGPAAGEKSSISEHPIGVSAPSKRTRLYDDVFHQPLQKVSCTGVSEMTAFHPVRKRKSTERHIQAKLNSGDALQCRHKAEAPTQRQKAWKASSSESFPSISSKDRQNDAEPCNTQDKATLPKSPLEEPAFGQAEGKTSAFCKPINIVFSPSKGCMKIQMFGKTPRDEDGRRISQDNVPQPESPVEAPACGPAAGEMSSISEHPIGVSAPSKSTRLYDDEIKEMTVSQDSEQTENSSDYSHPYIPSHTPNNNEPFMSPVHGTDVRPMKIYYMHVQLKRGVAVLYHTKDGWEPPSKKIKMEEMTYIGKVHKNVPVYHMSEKKHMIAHEPMLDSGAQEKREEADSPAQPPALGGYPSAKTPEWLVALDSGFRCMACCRVFPTLKILQDHVEYGVREGFSCHVFHNAMAHLKFKARKRRKKEKKEKALFRR